MLSLKEYGARVLHNFEFDTEAFLIGEDSEEMYKYNMAYRTGQLSGLMCVAEGQDYSDISRIREKLTEIYNKAVRRKYDTI